MNNLTGKIIDVSDLSYYVYSQLMFNREYYVLTEEIGKKTKDAIKIYKLTKENENYYIDDNIDNKVIEKFAIFLSM